MIQKLFCQQVVSLRNHLFRKTIFRNLKYLKNMDCIDLNPPECVIGMTKLDREAFRKTIRVPKLKVPAEKFHKVLSILKKYLLKLENVKPVNDLQQTNTELSKTVAKADTFKELLLHPLAIKNWDSLPKKELNLFNIDESNFYFDEIQLSYDNWRADEILKFIIPKDQEGCTSYSKVGHIIHINLRDHLLPYKDVIGQIILDKVPGCRSVVNKAQTIDNTYRNFQLDLVCGEENYKVEVKENGTIFEFDFSKVYWNPRLSTEHERIVNLLRPGDVLYDVFAGVGPFSVPAGKKKCEVLANDLNPESYKWLQQNVKRNKCTGHVKTFNKDGRNFIQEDLKSDILAKWKSTESKEYSIQITMNLPAMAVEFLNAFCNLFSKDDIPEDEQHKLTYPLVHVYSFAKGENTKELVQVLVETNLQTKLTDNLVGIHFVRNVAPNKDMYRLSFHLTPEILFDNTKKRKNLTHELTDCLNSSANKVPRLNDLNFVYDNITK